MGDEAGQKNLRIQAQHLFSHFKSEIKRDNDINKLNYDNITLLASYTANSSENVPLPLISETISGVEGIMKKLQMIIDLHIDVTLREISKNMKIVCKDQSELMEKILFNIIKSLYMEKNAYATKVYQLAGMVKKVCGVKGIDESIASEKALKEITELYGNKPDEEANALVNVHADTTTNIEASNDGISSTERKEKQTQRQLVVDKEIQVAIQTIESMSGLSEDEKAYRKQELLRSREMGTDKTQIAQQNALNNAQNKQASKVTLTNNKGNYIEKQYVNGVGFVEKINIKKLEKYIKDLQIDLLQAKEYNMSDAERAILEADRMKKQMELAMEERLRAQKTFACRRIMKMVHMHLLRKRFALRYYHLRAHKIQVAYRRWHILKCLKWAVVLIRKDKWAAKLITKCIRNAGIHRRLKLKSIALIKYKMRRYAKRMQCYRVARTVRHITTVQALELQEYITATMVFKINRLEKVLSQLYPSTVGELLQKKIDVTNMNKIQQQMMEENQPNTNPGESVHEGTDILDTKSVGMSSGMQGFTEAQLQQQQSCWQRIRYLRSKANKIKTRAIECEKDVDTVQISRNAVLRVNELQTKGLITNNAIKGTSNQHELLADPIKQLYANYKVSFDERNSHDENMETTNSTTNATALNTIMDKDATELKNKLMLKLQKMDHKGHVFTKTVQENDKFNLHRADLTNNILKLSGTSNKHDKLHISASVKKSVNSTHNMQKPPDVSDQVGEMALGAKPALLVNTYIEILPFLDIKYKDINLIYGLSAKKRTQRPRYWLEIECYKLISHLSILHQQDGMLSVPQEDTFGDAISNHHIVPIISPITSYQTRSPTQKKIKDDMSVVVDDGTLTSTSAALPMPMQLNDTDFMTYHMLYMSMSAEAYGSQVSVKGGQTGSHTNSTAMDNPYTASKSTSFDYNCNIRRKTVNERIPDVFLAGLTTRKRLDLLRRLFTSTLTFQQDYERLQMNEHADGDITDALRVDYCVKFLHSLYMYVNCEEGDCANSPICNLVYQLMFDEAPEVKLKSDISDGTGQCVEEDTNKVGVGDNDCKNTMLHVKTRLGLNSQWGSTCLFICYMTHVCHLIKERCVIYGIVGAERDDVGGNFKSKVASNTDTIKQLLKNQQLIPSQTCISLACALNIVQYVCLQTPECRWKAPSTMLLNYHTYDGIVKSIIKDLFEWYYNQDMSGGAAKSSMRNDVRITIDDVLREELAIHQEKQAEAREYARNGNARGTRSELEEDSVMSDDLHSESSHSLGISLVSDPTHRKNTQVPRPPSASEVHSSVKSKERVSLQRQRWLFQEQQKEVISKFKDRTESSGRTRCVGGGSYALDMEKERREGNASNLSSAAFVFSRLHQPHRNVTVGEVGVDLLLENMSYQAQTQAIRAKSAPGGARKQPPHSASTPNGDGIKSSKYRELRNFDVGVMSYFSLIQLLLPYHIAQCHRVYLMYSLNALYRMATLRGLCVIHQPIVLEDDVDVRKSCSMNIPVCASIRHYDGLSHSCRGEIARERFMEFVHELLHTHDSTVAHIVNSNLWNYDTSKNASIFGVDIHQLLMILRNYFRNMNSSTCVVSSADSVDMTVSPMDRHDVTTYYNHSILSYGETQMTYDSFMYCMLLILKDICA